MARMDTIKDTAIPTRRVITSQEVKSNPNFTIFNKLAPNITGMARKKVYSAARVLDVPSKMPPMIVAPEREVHGISASTWKIPMHKAVFQVLS